MNGVPAITLSDCGRDHAAATWDAIVIGSGIGGSSAARLLAAVGGKMEDGSMINSFFDFLSGRRLRWNRMTEEFERFINLAAMEA